MSKKGTRTRCKTKTNPTILRRKRKAESDVEVGLCDSSFEEIPQVQKDDTVPYRSSFGPSSRIELLAASHPLNRPSTLPDLPWASGGDIWKNMVFRDITYVHNHKMFDQHIELEPRMRSVLLDWLIEVSEVYKLHRDTLYLAQDLIDRYLANGTNVPKQQLQLLGVTSLFIAAKVEEIYPPKLSEFAYVTDGACTEREILHKELVILMTLDWQVNPVTISSWLSIFLQVATYSRNESENFERQSFSGRAFSEICQLLDLCILDVNSLQFPYSVLAASAITHLVSKEVSLKVSGFKWSDIANCVHWMNLFVETISENGSSDPKYFVNTSSCDKHNIQTHNVNLKLLDLVHMKQQQMSKCGSASTSSNYGVLTPPHSLRKISLQNVTN